MTETLDLHELPLWKSYPGWSMPPLCTFITLALKFPDHRRHLLSAEATIDLAQRFWCHNCQQELVLPLIEIDRVMVLDIGKCESPSPWPDVRSQDEPLAPLMHDAYRALPLDGPITLFTATLGIQCEMNAKTGLVSTEDLQRFAAISNWLCDRGLLTAKTEGPVAVKLGVQRGKFHRGMLLLYVISDHSRNELNARLGLPLLVEEGDMPIELPATWELPQS